MTDAPRIKGKDGFALIMVMIVLLAAIIVGIFLSRTSFIETKIATNESRYTDNITRVEAALDWALLNHATAISNVGNIVGTTWTYNIAYPATGVIDATVITCRLTDIRKPPLGSGNDPARFRTRYYDIRATRQGNTMTLGVHKAFPRR